MLFSSNIFIFLYLPVALAGYQAASYFGRNAMLIWLSLASLFFYGYWIPAYLLLLLASIAMNFLFARGLGEDKTEPTRSRWLIFAIVANLLLLGYYKYLFPLLNFFHEHHVLPQSFTNIALPLGISFFTFTQIAYLIDLRQNIAKQQGIVPYTVFVTFFPHLIAGPIIHPRELMPQLERGRIGGLRADDLALGASWFIMGLAKKVLIADRLAPMADVVYAHPYSAGPAVAWMGAVTYSMQLYFDFSGYSDMALGLARMFSLEFPINFNSPYKSQGMIEFWTRWHMTLSRYLNEYLFTPITRAINTRRLERGQKVSKKAMATPSGFGEMVLLPLMLTMLIAGVWHGAGLQFVLWGLLQGVLLTINHAWRVLTPRGHRLHKAVPAAVMVGLTYLSWVVAEIFFRASSIGDALRMLRAMAGLEHGTFAAFSYFAEMPAMSHFLANPRGAVLALALCFAIVWGLPNTQQILGQEPAGETQPSGLLGQVRWRPTMTWSLGLTAVFCVTILLLDASTSFLYFQF